MVASESLQKGKPEMEEEIILTSHYRPISFPQMKSYSAVEFILNKVQENIQNGYSTWVTNSATRETIKFLEIEPMSRKVASAMCRRGMGKGDVGLYLTSDVTRIFPITVGVWRTGGLMYSSYSEDTRDTIGRRIKESRARWIFCDPVSVTQCQLAVAQVHWPVEIIVFGNVADTTSVDELFLDDGTACPTEVPTRELNDPILVLCTSGTTGKSKGAIYTNKSLLAFCFGTASLPLTETPVLLLLRCTHVLGLLLPMRNACRGHSTLMMHDLTSDNILKSVQDYKPTFVFGFPYFLLHLVESPEAHTYDRSSIENICTGGMVIPDSFIPSMFSLPNLKHVMNGYGLTEIGAVSTTIDLGGCDSFRTTQSHPSRTVGQLYPNTDLKVMDLESGRSLGPMKRGELALRSPIMATGYWNQPKETAASFKNGWFKTGDLGYYDENGFVFIVDRIKEIFKYFNNHISPSEIEAEILKHPYVAEASVFGVLDPDGGDHIPRALVVLKPEMHTTPQQIQEFAERNLAEYKKIRGGVFIVDELPRGRTGKIVRSAASRLSLPPIVF